MRGGLVLLHFASGTGRREAARFVSASFVQTVEDGRDLTADSGSLPASTDGLAAPVEPVFSLVAIRLLIPPHLKM